MSEYLLSIVGIVFITGILSSVLPEGKTAGMIRATAKLCCLIVILAPVAEFIYKGGGKEKIFSDFLDESVIQTDEAFINYCSRERIDEAETLLKEEILRKYGLAVGVQIEWEYTQEEINGYTADEIRIRAIVITVPGGTNEESKATIVEEIEENYKVEVRCIER